MSSGLVIAAVSDRGRVREVNEDSVCILTPPQVAPEMSAVLLVADGMGGHQAGEVASRFVAARVAELFSSDKYREWVDYAPSREDYPLLALKEILERLHEQLSRMANNRPDWRGMGTTATMGLVIGSRLYVGHVGDSRAYLVSNGRLKQITRDHTWVMEQVEQGAMSARQAAADSRKNQLMQALGATAVIRVERQVESLAVGDTLIFCSDGLTNLVTDQELAHYAGTAADVRAAGQALVDLANQRGGHDNITVVIARVTPDTQGVMNLTPTIGQTAGKPLGELDTLKLPGMGDTSAPAPPSTEPPGSAKTPVLGAPAAQPTAQPAARRARRSVAGQPGFAAVSVAPASAVPVSTLNRTLPRRGNRMALIVFALGMFILLSVTALLLELKPLLAPWASFALSISVTVVTFLLGAWWGWRHS